MFSLNPDKDYLADHPVTENPPPDQGDAQDPLAHLDPVLHASVQTLAPLRLGSSKTVSGLSAYHRWQAQKIGLHYMDKMLASPGEVNYTEGGARWMGIQQGRSLAHLFPYWGDCSSTATFLYWRALNDVHPGAHDIINGLHWAAGYTGTMRLHGMKVTSPQIFDAVHYGSGTGRHVAIYVGADMVFSHGSMGGPYKSPVHYRGDFFEYRRMV